MLSLSHHLKSLLWHPPLCLIILVFQLQSCWVMKMCGAHPMEPGFWKATWKFVETSLLANVGSEHAYLTLFCLLNMAQQVFFKLSWRCISPVQLRYGGVWTQRHRFSSLFQQQLPMSSAFPWKPNEEHTVEVMAHVFCLISQLEDELWACHYDNDAGQQTATNRWPPDDGPGPAMFRTSAIIKTGLFPLYYSVILIRARLQEKLAVKPSGQ